MAEQKFQSEPAPNCPQPAQWEYLLLSESVYKASAGVDALVPLMGQTRDQVIASDQGKLFA